MHNNIINAQTLHALMQANAELLILDARHDLMDAGAGFLAYKSAHIKDAHFVHMDHDLSGEKTGRNGRHPLPDLDVLAKKLRVFGLNDNTQVVVYDANNSMMAARAWWLLRHLGHEAVAVLNGGLQAWQTDCFSVTDALSIPASTGGFSRKTTLNRIVTADDLLSHLNSDYYRIIDARAPERFSGVIEPIDPIGGHIPRAHNHFFMRNLNALSQFKSPSELHMDWKFSLANHPIAQIVNQCGSGVTACHNLLAQHVAGFSGAALYPGSWSEWCSDTQRPIER